MGRGRGSRMVRMQCGYFAACGEAPPTQMGTTQSPTHEHTGWHRPRGGCGCAAVHVGCAPGCGSVGRGKCARVRKPTQSVASMVESRGFHRNKTNFSRGVSHGAGSHSGRCRGCYPKRESIFLSLKCTMRKSLFSAFHSYFFFSERIRWSSTPTRQRFSFLGNERLPKKGNGSCLIW